ncbi:MAG: DUF3299 domain-containing protein [Spirosomataceae bacterium]
MNKPFFLYFFIALFTFTTVQSIAQTPRKITWDTLRDVTFKKKWNANEGMFILEPQFGEKVKELNSKEIVLTGYMIPVDIDANYYVLSANPFASCFFCGQAGPESVVSVKFKNLSKRFNTDDRVSIKGKFRLNASDINDLNYIIDAAEVAP